jgi:hypothetical protein
VNFILVGFAYLTIEIDKLYSYAVFLINTAIDISIDSCIFESDEKVSLNAGFIIAAYIQSISIKKCLFKASKKK